MLKDTAEASTTICTLSITLWLITRVSISARTNLLHAVRTNGREKLQNMQLVNPSSAATQHAQWQHARHYNVDDSFRHSKSALIRLSYALSSCIAHPQDLALPTAWRRFLCIPLLSLYSLSMCVVPTAVGSFVPRLSLSFSLLKVFFVEYTYRKVQDHLFPDRGCFVGQAL